MVTADAVVTGGAMSAGYPPEWEFDGLLMNGEAVVVRPIQSADAPALVSLHAIESPEPTELDLNPILVSPAGALVVDCKARLAPRQPGPGPLFPALRRRPPSRSSSTVPQRDTLEVGSQHAQISCCREPDPAPR